MSDRGIDLHFDLLTCPTDRTAAEIMERLGVKYKDAMIAPGGPKIIFRGCKNVPKELPKYIERR